MNNNLHVVLGAFGATGQAVVKALISRNLKVRAVERRKTIPKIETVNADLLNLDQTVNAIKGATHVYLCVGIKYSSKVWMDEWPIIMENVISSCETANAKLIFFDNVYMYGPSPLKVLFDESNTQTPVSQKGTVRKKIADKLIEAHNSGRVKAVIGRSADFYGPNAVNSPFYIALLQRILLNKAPQSLGEINIKHTYSYSLDNGRALVALALDENTYGQVWHLPVSEPITIEEVVVKFNEILHTNFNVLMMPRFLLGIMGIFNPPIKEIKEMLYQFDEPYIMSYVKFKKHFPNFKVTTLDVGISAMLDSFKH